MKGGQTPIHIMRWAAADYVNDPFVRRCYQRRDYRTAAFYPVFLFYSHMEGGDLPADVDELAAIVLMPPRDVEAALKVCTDAGKIRQQHGRLYHKRVKGEVLAELQYREQQRALGKKGGRPRRLPIDEGVAEGDPKGSLFGNQSPPSPSPSPSPAPTNTPPTPRKRGASTAPPAPAEEPNGNGHRDPARDDLRAAALKLQHQVEQARVFAVDQQLSPTREDLRTFRSWFRAGATLAVVQARIERGEHLARETPDGSVYRPEVRPPSHLGAEELDLLDVEPPAEEAQPPPGDKRRS